MSYLTSCYILIDHAKQQFKTAIQSKYINEQIHNQFPNTSELEAFGIFDPHPLTKC